MIKKILYIASKKLSFISAFYANPKNANKIILIYNMGKVGSSTLYNSLKKYFFPNNIFHIHFIDQGNLKNVNDSFQFLLALRLKKRLNRYKKKRIFIISIVREPIQRDISSVFQNLTKIFKKPFNEIQKLEVINYLHSNVDHQFFDHWFINEFEKVLGINLTTYDFNKSKGYMIINHENKRILLIRLDKLNGNIYDALKDLINLEDIKLLNENVSHKKNYHNLYTSVLSSYSPSIEKVNNIYNSKYVRFFYSDEEISQFKEKWLKKC